VRENGEEKRKEIQILVGLVDKAILPTLATQMI
jgi:hypothetical protein